MIGLKYMEEISDFVNADLHNNGQLRSSLSMPFFLGVLSPLKGSVEGSPAGVLPSEELGVLSCPVLVWRDLLLT
jgi:hypothetical protein